MDTKIIERKKRWTYRERKKEKKEEIETSYIGLNITAKIS